MHDTRPDACEHRYLFAKIQTSGIIKNHHDEFLCVLHYATGHFETGAEAQGDSWWSA